MKLDDAIKLALEYETGVHNAYLEAMIKTSNEAGKRVFRALCDEEMGHVKYLQDRLAEWQKAGKINVKKLATSVPAKEAIEKSLEQLHKTMKAKGKPQDLELALLKKALDAEIKTTLFYKEMVSKLNGEGQQLFRQFVEIEQGHEAIVQAEINSVSNCGVWLDTLEFRLEVEPAGE